MTLRNNFRCTCNRSEYSVDDDCPLHGVFYPSASPCVTPHDVREADDTSRPLDAYDTEVARVLSVPAYQLIVVEKCLHNTATPPDTGISPPALAQIFRDGWDQRGKAIVADITATDNRETR